MEDVIEKKCLDEFVVCESFAPSVVSERQSVITLKAAITSSRAM